MNMRKHLKNYFIPHPENDHKPHMLREASVISLTLFLVLIFGFSIFQATLIKESPEFTAAVIPGVLVDLANEDRIERGLGELAVNPTLEKAARLKAEHMAENSYFAHVSPDGFDPWYWFYRAGYDFMNAGENLAVNFVDSQDVEEAWMDSPGHRANILNGKFTEIGIAAVKGTYKGKKTLFVVQMFGTPSTIATAQRVPVVQNTPTPTATAQVPATGTVAGSQTTVKRASSTKASTTNVLGAQVVAEPDPNMYVEIENAKPQETGSAVTQAEVTKETSVWQKFLARPRLVVEWGYVLIGLLIALVLGLMIFIEMHKQHPRNIFYGVALLVLIGLLSYLNFLLLSANIVVV